MARDLEDGRAGITADLVRQLVRSQFPRWADRAVVPVPEDGWDNRTYRLGSDLAVRLPTAAGYAPAVEKECRWLPVLAPNLPLPVPSVLGVGTPDAGYDFPWSVRGWLDGETASRRRIADLAEFAETLAGFLRALQECDPSGGPAAGEHSWFRGASLSHYDDETRSCVSQVAGSIDATRALAVWDDALAADWSGPPVWFHGDVATGNLLVLDGRLAAVIDFGTCGVGDPACDLVIAWTLLCGDSRRVFRSVVGQDDGTWARARGWVLWKALLGLSGAEERVRAERERRLIEDVLADDLTTG